MRIYISGGLTNLEKPQLKDTYAALGELCEGLGFSSFVPHLMGTDPVKNPDILATTVWRNDHREVAAADIVIAYVGVPSLGVGAELEIARVTASELILWWFRADVVSRMALGNPGVRHRIEAEDEADLHTKLLPILKTYKGLLSGLDVPNDREWLV